MTQLINPQKFTDTVGLLRSFFLEKGFLEVHTQNRLSILAACEDPFNVATYNYADQVWPLPQTGQMWLEHELLTKPSSKPYSIKNVLNLLTAFVNFVGSINCVICFPFLT